MFGWTRGGVFALRLRLLNTLGTRPTLVGGRALRSAPDRRPLPSSFGRRSVDNRRVTVPVSLLPHLRRSRDLIDRRFAEPLDLDELAATALVSKYHFLRCFAQTYGMTPSATSPSDGSNGPRTCCGPPTSPSPRSATSSATPAWGRSAPRFARAGGRDAGGLPANGAPRPAAPGMPRLLRVHARSERSRRAQFGRSPLAARRPPYGGRS